MPSTSLKARTECAPILLSWQQDGEIAVSLPCVLRLHERAELLLTCPAGLRSAAGGCSPIPLPHAGSCSPRATSTALSPQFLSILRAGSLVFNGEPSGLLKQKIPSWISAPPLLAQRLGNGLCTDVPQCQVSLLQIRPECPLKDFLLWMSEIVLRFKQLC